MRTALVVMMCCAAARDAAAQTAIRLPQHDVALSVGWAGSEYDTSSSYDRWRGSLLLNITAGRYWTDHLKTEFEIGWLDAGTTEVYTDLQIGGVPTYALVQFDARDVRIGAAQLYQFGRNQWVHPYLGVGVDVIARQTTKRRPQQTRDYPPPRGAPIVIPPLDERDSVVLAQPFLNAGLKMYASERMFFTTALKLGITHDVDHAVWRIGVGFDF